MERCPICKARLKDALLCPRCGADLTMPLEIEARAESLQQQVVTLLANGELPGARRLAEQLLTLKRTPLARILRGFIQYLEQEKAVLHHQPSHHPETVPKVIILGYQP